MSQVLLIVLIVIAALVALAGLGAGAYFGWRRMVKRHLVQLIGKREGVRAGLASIERVVAGLAQSSDGELVAIALDPDAEERRALAEIASRMRIAAEDLATMALPKQLIDAANDMSDAAELLWEQSEAVVAADGVGVLDALAAIDLAPVRRFLSDADAGIAALQAEFHVDEQVVYGGGLYI